MDLCVQETGKCDWPAVPERYWKRVYEEIEEIELSNRLE